MAVFTLEDALSVWANLGKHSSFVSGIMDGHKIYYPSGLTTVSSVVRLERRSREAIIRNGGYVARNRSDQGKTPYAVRRPPCVFDGNTFLKIS